jgi:hypothetical protein
MFSESLKGQELSYLFGILCGALRDGFSPTCPRIYVSDSGVASHDVYHVFASHPIFIYTSDCENELDTTCPSKIPCTRFILRIS